MNDLIVNAVSMTSLEISELVGSRHDNVRKSIETLAKRGVIRLPEIQVSEKLNNLGLPQKSSHYVFSGEQGKRDSIVVVAQLSPEFTARLVDRWQELEQNLVTHNTVSQCVQIVRDNLDIGELLGVPRHLLQIEAVKDVERLTGRDFSHLLPLSPHMDNIPVDDVMLEPCDIAKRYGLKGSTHDGAMINRVLAGAGLQRKDSKSGEWQLTDEGKPFAQLHGWKSKNSSKSGYNYKWRLSGISHILDAHFNR